MLRPFEQHFRLVCALVAANAHHIAGQGQFRLDHLAQVGNVGVNHAAGDEAAAALHFVQQLVAREHAPAMADERTEQLELERCDLDRPSRTAVLNQPLTSCA